MPAYRNQKKNRQYSLEFKRSAVEMSLEEYVESAYAVNEKGVGYLARSCKAISLSDRLGKFIRGLS